MPLTNYGRNKLLDWLHRGEAFSQPANLWAALLTAASAATYTEQTSGGVSRVQIGCALANWSGTQGDGTTTASSGTSGTISNNAEISFTDSSGADAQISAAYVGIFDAASSGNLIEYFAIRDAGGTAITRTWYAGDDVVIPAAALRITYT